MEVWDTPEHQARFMQDRLGEALAKGASPRRPRASRGSSWRRTTSREADRAMHPRSTIRAMPTGAERRVRGAGYFFGGLAIACALLGVSSTALWYLVAFMWALVAYVFFQRAARARRFGP
jgi:hypothetical protein